jgi:carboxyl-terminal processing protease
MPAQPARSGGGGRGPTGVMIALAVVALLAGAALFLSGYSLGRKDATTPGTPATEEQAFQPFWDAYRAITERYAGGDVDRKLLIEGAIKGMFDALDDPYSSYLTSQEYRDSLQGISGQFEGIGAEISTKSPDGASGDCATLGPSCRLVIVAPIEGSPSEAAGLRPGDLVLAVDGTSLDGLTIDEARDRIRGPKGTQVVLTIERDGGAPFEVPITRDVIVQREVITETLADGTIGYVRLTGFSEGGGQQFADAVKEDVDAGLKKIIVDLRGNPGGFITAARTVASQFVDSGPIFWQEDADGTLTPTNAESGGAAIDPSIEVVVLVDRGSASASEIVAGALQDTGRATLVGETTFGKGTVQQWQPLEDDNGGFRLTVAKWLTPDKRWIHRVGIEPDVPVAVPADTPADQDPALDRAIELLGTTALLEAA